MDYKQIYNHKYFSGENSFFYKLGYGRFAKFYFDALYRQMKKYFPKTSTPAVLDVGCAYGLMLERFPNNFKKFGVDVSEYAISEARKRVIDGDFAVINTEDPLPYSENFFDLVFCVDVLEHLENPGLALDRIHTVLKKGAILYIKTPNLNWLRRKLYAEADRKEHHISLFEHAKLLVFLKERRFEVVDHWTSTDLGYFFLPKFRSNIGEESTFVCRKI